MLLHSLRLLCSASGGSGSIWKYLEALVRLNGMSGRFGCSFRTDLDFADDVKHIAMSYTIFAIPFPTNAYRQPRSGLVICGSHQDWYRPLKLRLSMCQHFSRKWIIIILIFLGDIVYHILTKRSCSHGAIVYHGNSLVNSTFGFCTIFPTGIWPMVIWLLAKHSVTCHTIVHEISSKFPCWLFIFLTVNFEVPDSICSDWNCGSYSRDIHL